MSPGLLLRLLCFRKNMALVTRSGLEYRRWSDWGTLREYLISQRFHRDYE